ncbi:class I SAM-dependent methyltransferase [Litorilinea aerophila]|uniref:Class I SAM-dependent methyltransferase n=1 Tax=Litorilinea aerophila TaxID=1204385 RepID=A0A540VJA2_9CHLR|nr:class I SAM-dependent methyltransferase [Litorilinea aerophila]MCC9075707.1 class I SAM-dependent methyltransferase [Litorilinea aerophila]OUC05685.1 hypothetical protein RY27_25700 [Litorilinea aerophila]
MSIVQRLRHLLYGKAKPAETSDLQFRAAQRKIPRFDVTPFAAQFDLLWLEPILHAPAWMTRAERLMLFTLIFCLRPQRYLEIGTFQGGSALIICRALDALESDARMYLVDPSPQILPNNWEKISHRAELFQGHSPDILQTAANKAQDSFDFVFIDGDHSYAGAKRDAEGVLPFVKTGSYILFHDSFFEEVRRAIDDFIDEHSGQVMDLGLLTREITTQQTSEGQKVEWGGLRLLQVIG